VAQAIPSYCMSVFLLPSSIGDDIEKMLNSFWWGSKGDRKHGIRWMSWDKLTMRKEFGGMGFRSILGFNLAMLGKQGWKLLTNPDAMVSRIFKAKYYPNGDFLGASLGHNPSYVWRSIWSSRPLLKEGYRWRIGNGSLIPIWRTPWLRNEDNPTIVTPILNNENLSKVSDLIDVNQGCWNRNRVSELFCDRDANEILKIPLVNLGKRDEIIWRFDKKGIYSVKSAYRVCVDVMINRDDWKVEGDWQQLWTLPIPPKVKQFMWRLGRDCLPNRQRLMSKGVHGDSNCVVCHRYTEYNWHLFLDCADSIACWRQVKLWNELQNLMENAEGFNDVFKRIWHNFTTQQLVSFAMTSWSLWRKRNLQLWEQKIESTSQVIGRANGTLQAWQHARQPTDTVQPPQQHVQVTPWQPPPTDFVKCNLDAAIFVHEQCIGMGACLRDDKGNFILAMTTHENVVMTAQEAEAWSLYQGIQWVANLGYNKVIFELDCKIVVDDVNKMSINQSEYGSIIQNCRTLLHHYNNFIVVFARRQANGSAHALARAALSHASRSTFNVIPNCIATIVMNEMP
jgi:ribonuclease HI